MPDVLYVEDELLLARIVKESLESRGYHIVHCANGDQALDAFRSGTFDICVLDVMLPGIDGFELAGQIRKIDEHIPIIFLTAKSQANDVIHGFDAGGNDYIKKPFSMEELIVRIKNLLKLTRQGESEDEKIKLGDFTFNPSNMTLSSTGNQHNLSYKENEILKVLTQSLNQKVERNDLLMKVWGNDSFFNSRTLDVYVRKLRSIFEEDPKIQLITLRGVGYIFYLDPS